MTGWRSDKMNMGSGKIKALLSGLCLFCLMLNAGFVAGAQAKEITVTTAEKMMEDCKREGPFVIVNALTKNGKKKWGGKKWNETLEKIVSGDPKWIDASACLSIGAAFNPDIETLHSLHIAWAKALSKSPWEILGLEGEYGISTAAACSMPFEQPEPAFVEAYMKDTLQALKTVTGPVMEPDREDCERHLKDAYERYKNRKEQFPESGN